MDNIELMKQGYKDNAESNIEAVLNLFHSEIEWNGCTGFPFITGDGKYVGSNTVAQEVLAQLPKHYEDFSIDIKELFGCGDKVVMVGYYRGIWKATGKRFKANATHVWTLKDGKVTRFFLAVDTAVIINP